MAAFLGVSLFRRHWLCLCIHFGHLSISTLICDFHPVCKFLRIQDGVWRVFSFLWCAFVTTVSPTQWVLSRVRWADCLPTYQGGRVAGPWETFRRVCCFCKPLSADPSHCISRWNPKFCHVDTLYLTLNFAQENLVVLISEIDMLSGRWVRKRQGRRATEDFCLLEPERQCFSVTKIPLSPSHLSKASCVIFA